MVDTALLGVIGTIVTAIIGIIGTILGAILGAGIQYLSARKSAEEASERVFEERAIDSKFERLERLHDSLDDCLSSFKDVIVQGPKDVDDYSERVRKPYDEMIDAADKARIYLSPEERETIEETIDEFNEARTYLRLWAQEQDSEWQDFPDYHEYSKSRDELDDAADSAIAVIRQKLDPEYEQED